MLDDIESVQIHDKASTRDISVPFAKFVHKLARLINAFVQVTHISVTQSFQDEFTYVEMFHLD